jgi:hypothetical protein
VISVLLHLETVAVVLAWFQNLMPLYLCSASCGDKCCGDKCCGDKCCGDKCCGNKCCGDMCCGDKCCDIMNSLPFIVS